MVTRLKEVDVVVVGLGWTGGILGKALAEAGLKVVALERGAMRTSDKDYSLPNIRDELRYVVRHDLMQNTARDTLTIRNNPAQEALPMRRLGSFLPGEVVGGSGRALERPHLALDRHGIQGALALRGALRQEFHPRRHDHPGLGHHLRGARALLRQVRACGGGVGQGRQPARPDSARRQSVRSAACARIPAPAARDHFRGRDVRRRRQKQRVPSIPASRGQRLARLHQSRWGQVRGLPVLRLLPALRLRGECKREPAHHGDPDCHAQPPISSCARIPG